MKAGGDNFGQGRMLGWAPAIVAVMAAGLFLICIILLLASFYVWAAEMTTAIRYPFQLNYGEGIVWQQADMIMRGEGYRALSDASFIVFHYPPLYHVSSAVLAKILDINWLMAGRIVSVVSTLGAAGVIGALTFQAVRDRESTPTSLLCACFSGLIVFTLMPVAYWSPLARVDMISILLTLAGVWFGLRSIKHAGNLFPAAVFFVLALFAKQTAISAPVATFAVLLVLRPSLAWRGLLLGAGLGLAIFVALTFATSGQFVKHVIVYNSNRLAPENLGTLGFILASHAILFAIVYFSITRFIRKLSAQRSHSSGIAGLRKSVGNDRLKIVELFSVVWFCIACLTSLAIIKSGAYVNYLIEWVLSWSLLAGLALRGPTRDVVRMLSGRNEAAKAPVTAAVVFAALGVQFASVPLILILQVTGVSADPMENRRADQKHTNDLRELVRTIRDAPGPVISDNMVAVKLAGKEVVWESAIFAELTATGQWNENAFIDLISRKTFGLIVTEGAADDRTFKARYSPAVVLAIDRSYPRKETLAGYRVHRPSP